MSVITPSKVDRSVAQKVDRSTQVADSQSPPSQKFDRSFDRSKEKRYRTAPKKKVNRSWAYLVDNKRTLPNMDSKDWRPFLNAARGYYRESLKDGAKQELNNERWETCKEHFDKIGFQVHEISHNGSTPRKFMQRVNKEEEKEGFNMSYELVDLESESESIQKTFEAISDLETSEKEGTFTWDVNTY